MAVNLMAPDPVYKKFGATGIYLKFNQIALFEINYVIRSYSSKDLQLELITSGNSFAYTCSKNGC